MRPVLLAATAVSATALTTGLLAGPASAAGPVTVLHATMTAAQEVPGPGEAGGKGNAVLRVDAATGEICYTVVTHGTGELMAGHIHRKAPGAESGPVVQPFTAQASASSFRGCVVNPGVAAGLVADPSEYYVNVHDAAYPAGAVRGDLG